MFQCFILHVTTSKNVLAAVKILQNIFSGLMLVAKYSVFFTVFQCFFLLTKFARIWHTQKMSFAVSIQAEKRLMGEHKYLKIMMKPWNDSAQTGPLIFSPSVVRYICYRLAAICNANFDWGVHLQISLPFGDHAPV